MSKGRRGAAIPCWCLGCVAGSIAALGSDRGEEEGGGLQGMCCSIVLVFNLIITAVYWVSNPSTHVVFGMAQALNHGVGPLSG